MEIGQDPVAGQRRTARARLLGAVVALATFAVILVGGAAPAHAAAVAPVSGNYYFLRGRPTSGSGNRPYCMDAPQPSGGYVLLSYCDAGWDKQFKLERFVAGGKDVWRLQLRYAPSMCVAIYQGPTGLVPPSLYVVTEVCSQGWEQLFVLQPVNHGYLLLPRYETGICVADAYPLAEPSDTLFQYYCYYGADWYWEVWNSMPV